MRLFGAKGRRRLKMRRLKMGAVMHVSRNGPRPIDCRDDEGDALLGVVPLSGFWHAFGFWRCWERPLRDRRH